MNWNTFDNYQWMYTEAEGNGKKNRLCHCKDFCIVFDDGSHIDRIFSKFCNVLLMHNDGKPFRLSIKEYPYYKTVTIEKAYHIPSNDIIYERKDAE